MGAEGRVVSEWRLIPNPALRGKDPSKLMPICHDGTPFITIRCSCGYHMHIHLSQIESLPANRIVSLCHSCGQPLEFDKDWLLEAIEKAWKSEP